MLNLLSPKEAGKIRGHDINFEFDEGDGGFFRGDVLYAGVNDMKTQEKTIDRRVALKWIIGGTALTAGSIGIVSELARRRPLSRIIQLERTIGETAIPIPDSWYRTLDRVSIESIPLDKGRLDSLPMLPVDDKGYCKTGALIQAQKYGLAIPDLYDHLGMNFSSTGGRIMARSTDWYAVIPAEPKKAYFSASKNNIPKEYWSADGFERAKKIRATPYGWFIAAGPEGGHAWKDLADVCMIGTAKEKLEPGAYFVGPDGGIINRESSDVSMDTLDKLVLTLVENQTGTKIPYAKIKGACEKNRVPYKDRGEIPAIPVRKLFELAGMKVDGKAFIFYANDYSASIPPWRQDGLTVLFEKRYSSFGAPTKLIGRDLNKSGQINGFYKIEAL